MKNHPLQEDLYYHIFNRGNNRENLFLEHKNYTYFLLLLKKYLLPIANIYAYCLLPNHFHLVLKIKEFESLPLKIREGKTKLHQPFSNLFNAYAKAINKAYGRRGSLFQEHLKKSLISDETYLRNAIIYTHLNPRHHELWALFYDYPYSSYRALISDKPTFLKKKETISLFNDINNFKYVHRVKSDLIPISFL